jgi:endonuclease/exonuclease/phosphatase family metal-dependent hydrolase
MKSTALILALFLVFGCIIQPAEQPQENQTVNETAEFTNVTVAAFNIQVFGTSKASKDDVMEVLANISRNFDIIAVQEIRDSSQTALPALVDRINSHQGPKYNYTVGPRLGRTSSKEQYAYIYREGIELLGNYTFNDSSDIFHREPYIARFRADGFDFVLIVLHTDPDETPEELDALPLVLADAETSYGEDDLVIIGDLNADCSYLKKSDNVSLRAEEYIWLIGDDEDTTTKSTDCAYDRVIIRNATVEDYIEAGIFRFDNEYGLNQSMTESVSDHYPVWVMFKAASQAQE